MRLRDCWKWAFALSSSLLVAGAAQGTAASAASAGGTTKVVVTKYGFAVTLPAGWQRVTLTKAGIAKMAQRIDKVDPTLGSQVSSQSAQATIRRTSLYAIGTPEGGILPNMNVLVQSAAGLPSGSAFFSSGQSAIKSAMQQEGFSHVTTTVVHIPFGSVIEASYSVPNVSVAVTQLYALHKGQLYTITFSPASVGTQFENTWHWV
jgi:hypothetical protein